MMTSAYVLSQIVNGLILGSMYALIAIGFSMIYGIVRLINFAHGDIYTIGAFTTLASVAILNLPFPLALVLFVRLTKVGVAMRAKAENYDLARLMGINIDRMIMLAFAIGSSLAAVSGLIRGRSGDMTSARTIGARLILSLLVGCALIWAATRSFDPYTLSVNGFVGIKIMLAASLNLTNGFIGLFSLGQPAFMTIGGYLTAILVLALVPDRKAAILKALPQVLVTQERPFLPALAVLLTLIFRPSGLFGTAAPDLLDWFRPRPTRENTDSD